MTRLQSSEESRLLLRIQFWKIIPRNYICSCLFHRSSTAFLSKVYPPRCAMGGGVGCIGACVSLYSCHSNYQKQYHHFLFAISSPLSLDSFCRLAETHYSLATNLCIFGGCVIPFEWDDLLNAAAHVLVGLSLLSRATG